MLSTRAKLGYCAVKAAVIAVMLLAAGIAAVVFYLVVLDDLNPITFSNLPFPVDRQVYAPGDTVIRTADACRNSDAPATVYQGLRGATNYDYPEFTVVSQNLGCFESRIPVKLPDDLPPGRYRIAASVQFQVNALAVRRVMWETQEFTVGRGQ